MADHPETTTAGDGLFSPETRPWRAHHGLSILRLRTDLKGASDAPVRRAGDLVLGCYRRGDPIFADGYFVQGIGFACVLNEPDVEVVERP